jgi:hypothetical protein
MADGTLLTSVRGDPLNSRQLGEGILELVSQHRHAPNAGIAWDRRDNQLAGAGIAPRWPTPPADVLMDRAAPPEG